MSCLTCANFEYVQDEPLGTCVLDGRRNHPGYWCNRHELKASTESRLGLTMTETRWLQANRADPSAANLISLYQMVRRSPGDPGARGIFAATLRAWRRERPRGVLETSPKSASNPAGAEESTHAPQSSGRDPQARR